LSVIEIKAGAVHALRLLQQQPTSVVMKLVAGNERQARGDHRRLDGRYFWKIHMICAKKIARNHLSRRILVALDMWN